MRYLSYSDGPTWMPFPLRASTACALDLDHLRRMTLDDQALERDVLRMFLTQAGRLVEALAERPAEAGTLAHTLKGSARAIGALGVAEAAAAVENASRKSGDLAGPLGMLSDALAEARGAIQARLASPDLA
jgi:HPt (histidine-containing phosphotransfer) domain-containing protein